MNRKYLVRKSDRLLGGICSGLASYFNINKLLVRFAALVLFNYFSLEVALVYLLAWILVLSEPYERFEQKVFYNKIKESSELKLFKSRDSMLLGVCKGISLKLSLNIVGVRLLFGVSSLFLGFGLILYITFALFLPSKSDYEIKLIQRVKALKLKIMSEYH